jgi:hypothetical protein
MIARSRDYSLLDLEVVQQALARSPDQVSTHPESGMRRTLYDCSSVPLTPTGPEVRLAVATHALDSSLPKVGVERGGTVYELFVSTLPALAFAPSDVLDLYLHRGSFETVLADEDAEQDSDRWYSHTSCGQEFCQILAQWVWNLRLELGMTLSSLDLRTTEFAQARIVEPAQAIEPPPALKHPSPVPYGPPQWARPSFTHGFPGSAFPLQPDGTLSCPANHPLYPQERRPERDGSLRVLYAARISHCRSCPLRSQCQENPSSLKARRVSAVLWKDWPRCSIRRGWLKVVRSQTVCFTSSIQPEPSPVTTPPESVLTRSGRAHWRLSWNQRLVRNARSSDAPGLSVTLHGLPASFAASFGFALLATA